MNVAHNREFLFYRTFSFIITPTVGKDMVHSGNDLIRFSMVIGLVLALLFVSPISALGNSVPDFSIKGISGPTSLQKGKTVTLQVYIQNPGDSFLGHSLVSVYLSKDTTLKNGDDIVIGSFYTKDQIPHTTNTQAYQFSFRKNVPAKAKPGTYYYGAIIDPNNQITEKKESNNQYVNPKAVTIT